MYGDMDKKKFRKFANGTTTCQIDFRSESDRPCTRFRFYEFVHASCVREDAYRRNSE